MPERWRHKLGSIASQFLGLDWLFDLSGSVARLSAVWNVVGAVLPSIGFALIVPSFIWMWWAWWPTVRRQLWKGWQLYELLPEIEEQMDGLQMYGYDLNRLSHARKQSLLLFGTKLAALGIQILNIQGFRGWGLLLVCAAQRDLESARKLKPPYGDD